MRQTISRNSVLRGKMQHIAGAVLIAACMTIASFLLTLHYVDGLPMGAKSLLLTNYHNQQPLQIQDGSPMLKNSNAAHKQFHQRAKPQLRQSQQIKGQIFKRSFVGLGCLGVYDKAKFARLDRVCEDCYQLYREPDIHSACRADCFRNTDFNNCVDALLLSNDQKKLTEMVDELYGK